MLSNSTDLTNRAARLGFSVCALIVLGLLGFVPEASALTNPCGSGGSYSTSGAIATCTYASASNSGVTGTFAVPSGVTSIHVDAVGGKGGDDPGKKDFLGITFPNRTGGFGAAVSAGLPVSSGQQLYVYVAGNGAQAAASGAIAPGGANGGGSPAGSTGPGGGAGGGGGGSDLRTVPAPSSGSQTASLSSRLLTAAGGGGASDASNGGTPGNGNGGNAGQPGPSGFAGPAAQPGTANPNGTGSGGAGGGGGGPPATGGAGSQGAGGSGGFDCCYQGGGGGGGLYGGGGGDSIYGQPGAGGASWTEQAASGSSIQIDNTGAPRVAISWQASPANTSPPKLTGRAKVGRRLTCSAGGWSGSPNRFSYQWYRGRRPIPGARRSSHKVSSRDAGHRLSCQVTAYNAAGSSSTFSRSVRVAKVRPGLRVRSVSGRAVGAGCQFEGARIAAARSDAQCRVTQMTLSGTVDRRAKGGFLVVVLRELASSRTRGRVIRRRVKIRGGRWSLRVTSPSDNLEPGERWRYRITYSGNQSLRAASITGGFRVESEKANKAPF
jgi:glycine rich protein/Ig-like domain-containing protein